MTREELEALEPKDLYQTAKDLGLKTKKKTPPEVVTLILDSVAGTLQEEDGDEGENDAEVIGEDVEGPAEGDDTGEEGAEDTSDAEAPLEEVGNVPKLSASDKQFIKKNPELDARIKAEKERAKAMPPVATPGFTGQEPHRAVQAHNPAVRHGQHWPTVQEVKEALKAHIARGLQIIELHEDQWHFRIDGREGAGNLKMPLNQIIFQANILMRPVNEATEGLGFDEILAKKSSAQNRK